VCKGNVGRSQIAEALLKKYHRLDSKSAGTVVSNPEKIKRLGELGERVSTLFQSMKEEGIDLSKKKRKKITPEMVKEADKIIIMADHETVPDFLKEDPKVIYWDVKDPEGKNLDFHRKTKEQLKGLIDNFVEIYQLK